MLRLRRLRKLLAVAVVGYVALGLAAVARPPRYEVFPFFCWFLFPISPTVEERWGLRVHEVGGAPLPEPRWYEELGVTRDPWAMDAHLAIQALGRAVEAGDAAAAARLRRRIEANFLPTPARYDLVSLRFEVLERWRDGTLRAERRVARFVSGEPAPRLAASAGEPGGEP